MLQIYLFSTMSKSICKNNNESNKLCIVVCDNDYNKLAQQK